MHLVEFAFVVGMIAGCGSLNPSKAGPSAESDFKVSMQGCGGKEFSDRATFCAWLSSPESELCLGKTGELGDLGSTPRERYQQHCD